MGPRKGSLRWIPPRGIQKFHGSKKDNYQLKIEIKKTFSREEIRQKETQMGPHRGSQDDPATGDKQFQGSKKDDYGSKK